MSIASFVLLPRLVAQQAETAPSRVQDSLVNAQGSLQLKSLLADYAPGVNQGYARVVPSSSEPFVAYAVVIDGARPGERTGDGSLINSSP